MSEIMRNSRDHWVLTISEKLREFQLKVKWNSNFSENPFGNF